MEVLDREEQSVSQQKHPSLLKSYEEMSRKQKRRLENLKHLNERQKHLTVAHYYFAVEAAHAVFRGRMRQIRSQLLDKTYERRFRLANERRLLDKKDDTDPPVLLQKQVLVKRKKQQKLDLLDFAVIRNRGGFPACTLFPLSKSEIYYDLDKINGRLDTVYIVDGVVRHRGVNYTVGDVLYLKQEENIEQIRITEVLKDQITIKTANGTSRTIQIDTFKDGATELMRSVRNDFIH